MRFGSGLSFLLSYTAQKLIDDNSATAVVGANASNQDIYDRRGDRSVSANDVSQLLVVSSVFELPFGKGRRFGSGWSRPVNSVLGGWQMNGIATFQTGLPLAITTQNTSRAGNSVLRPNNNGHSAKLDGSVESRLSKYFDTSGRTLPDVRAPGTRNIDLSLFKSFAIVERMSLQFRAETFDLLNTPRFGNPDSVLRDAAFGVIAAQANSPRQVQFGLKLLF